ncbi:hypothetical protein FRC12_023076 [Ceratobasidium sp. 428]|nr:hypothetical protein FRC12_023076 [Ceratobasidium sp. 428]
MSRLEDLYLSTLSSREFLGAALTLIIYDIILTLHDEIHYVWSSRWTFARTAFHVNRMLGPIVFSLHLAGTTWHQSHRIFLLSYKRPYVDVFGYQLTDQTYVTHGI